MYISHIWEKSDFWDYGWNALVQSDRKFLNQLYCISTTDLWNNLMLCMLIQAGENLKLIQKF